MKKSILFLSGLDFKEKSIQVISKTPKAYLEKGWDVYYVVGRDTSINGDYYYEKVIDIEGISTIRFNIPLSSVHSRFNTPLMKGIISRIRNILLILNLYIYGQKILKNNKIDILYGYEVYGVLAARLLLKLTKTNSKFVTRFQGVLYVKEWLRKNNKLRFISNWDVITALKTPNSDLCIMTNDGSQGVDVLNKLNSKQKDKCLFLRNGVEKQYLLPQDLHETKLKHYEEYDNFYKFVSVSRLDTHKRVYRCINLIKSFKELFPEAKIIYTIIGEGFERQNLENLVEKMQLKNEVRFIGAIPHTQVPLHFELNNIFLSMYDSTNVGNPLLEAMIHNKLIVTLNNGDTKDLIQDNFNGVLFNVNDDIDLNDNDYKKISKKIYNILKNSTFLKEIKYNLKISSQEKLWSWNDRLNYEIDQVSRLLENEYK
ncbi:glycosyltransferase [Flammeovirga sp. OC4]|uniref:glycosyltransferase n=1 Tax=Flammeovirga sp. OC4 TaxID=1382345 RepID=UPI0005C515BB|nr:glycosyltransferase [Flammeovirga sp. OC4]